MRRLGKGDVIGGFAGATADAFTLFERLESKLEQYPGQLTRAAVELAKDWRTDRYLRRLEAMMIVADKDVSLVLTGTGDVLEPEAGVMGIGSGGNYALAAARALVDGPLDAEAIVRKADGHRGRHLRLHQPQRHHRNAADGLTRDGGTHYQFRAASRPRTCRCCGAGSTSRTSGEWWDDPDNGAWLRSSRRCRASRRSIRSSCCGGDTPIGYLQCYDPHAEAGPSVPATSRRAPAASISSSASPT